MPTRKIILWPLIVIVAVAAICGGVYYYYKRYIASVKWEPLLQNQLKELVLNASDSLYHIQYSKFDLNLASGDATLTDFKLTPDTNVYNQLVARHKAPDNLFILGVKKLSIRNVGAQKAYKEKILDINRITIDKPDLTVINKRLPFNDTVKIGKPKTPYDIIKKVFKKIRIDSIALNDISLKYINKSNATLKSTALKHLDINISDVYVDSLSARDSSRFYYTKGVRVKIHDYRIATPDSLYYVKLKQIYFSTSERKIVLDKVVLQPRYSKTGFYEKTQKAGDRFDLKFGRIAMNQIDLQRFLHDQKLYVGVMNVNSADVEIYHNSAYKGRKKSKIGKDPHQELQDVALDMRLNRLNVYRSDIRYLETNDKSGYTGVIQFAHTNGYFLNVTNDPDVKRHNPFMMAHLNTRFMNAANLNINFRFNLNASDGAFNYNGTLGKFDGRVLDKLVKPLALVHVQSADVDRLHFNVNASNYKAKGQLEFYYKNLNIQLLKKVEGQPGLKQQGLISKLANTLIIEDSNPDKKGNFRPGPINFVRPATLSFFSLLYKALLDGLKPSVGFDAKTETKVNKVVAKVSSTVTTVNNLLDKFHKFKEARKERREERRKEKEAKKQQEQKDKQQQDQNPKQR